MNAPITAERIEELKSLGYEIEDMGEEFGDEWEGQYRWLNDADGQFQESLPVCSVAEAWARADGHAKHPVTLIARADKIMSDYFKSPNAADPAYRESCCREANLLRSRATTAEMLAQTP